LNPFLKKESGVAKTKTLYKPITSTITGESWELSTVEGDVVLLQTEHGKANH
jgi:hypothetical protein